MISDDEKQSILDVFKLKEIDLKNVVNVPIQPIFRREVFDQFTKINDWPITFNV